MKNGESTTRYHFLFAGVQFGGNLTQFEGIKEMTLRHEDIESSWLTIEWDPPEFFTRIPPITTNWTLKAGLVMRERMRRLQKAGNIFHATFFNHYVLAPFYGSFRYQTPYVMFFDTTPTLTDLYSTWYGLHHSSDSLLEKWKVRFLRNVFNNAAFLLPHTQLVRDSLISDYGIAPNKIVVVNQGVDVKAWIPPARNQEAENLRILFVGSSFLRKGGDIVLRIAKREEFRHHEFHFVTHDEVEDRSENVFVHHGIGQNSDAIRQLYRTADVFVLPTRGDYQPVAILEAMSMGLPVISTSVGAIGHTVEDGKTGFVIPPGAEECFAERLRLLVEDSELRRKLGVNARRVSETTYNLELNTGVILEYLIKAAKTRGHYGT